MEQNTLQYARRQDGKDPLRHLREQFYIPTKDDLARPTIGGKSNDSYRQEPSTYLCGNSLGLQPLATKKYMQQYLDTWAIKGVYGHFKEIKDSHIPPFMNFDDDVAEDMSKLIGARKSEVALMQTLTANIHLMFAAFYKPTNQRWKIILEGKAFPSDHYAVESQLRLKGYDPESSMILIEPQSKDNLILSTGYILSIIDQHASETALLLLPGIQFYTGQFFDMPTITAHAHSKGIVVGWDLAHAVGNVPMKLHDWNVDFAAWCTYKYMNCGPGSIGGCFVHERHGQVAQPNGTHSSSPSSPRYLPRLAGWWGSSKSSRFAMTNQFEPIPGAAGFQLSNPSVADLTAVRASLDVFKQTSIDELRQKSLNLTRYLEESLDALAAEQERTIGSCFSIITPHEPEQRGAQISVLLKPGMLDSIMESLEEAGVVLDERKPDVIRVAPAPLYNTYEDVFNFIQVFRNACTRATEGSSTSNSSILAEAGSEAKGWSEVK